MAAGKETTSNFLIVCVIVFIIAVLPTYAGFGVGFMLGDEHIKKITRQPVYSRAQYFAIAKNPASLYKSYKYIKDVHDYYVKYDPRYEDAYFGNDFKMRYYGPPALAIFASLITLFLFRAPLTDFRPFKPEEKIHGDAKWASEAEIQRAKLRAKKGILLGRTGKNYLIADDFQHILLFAPTGSGKGVGFVIPNLLYWEESVICHDIKMENYELTSGYRSAKLNQPCYVWNPADPDGISHCYNPLDWISDKPGQMVDDVQKICNLVLPEQEFWQNEARSLMLGVILYLCAVPEKVTSFGEVVRTMRSDDVVYNLAVVLDTIGGRIHPVAYMNIAAFLQKADKERSGVISTLNSGLELWANPLIDTATASSDFDLQTLKKKKQTVYVGVTPDNLQRLEPLLKVFYQQATDFLTRKMPGKDEPHGVMFLLDEFPSLGEMPQFQIGIAYFRGYRVKLFLIVQDTQQLKGIYEEAGMNSFLSNSYYRITFSANNIETANMISQLVGNKTVQQSSFNKPKFLDLNPASRSMHVSETQRALLLPQEVIQLPRDEQIILVESFAPIKCKKIFYFKDKFFTKRLLEKIPLPVQEPYDPRKKKKAPPAPPPPPPEDRPAELNDAMESTGNPVGSGNPEGATPPPLPGATA
ncbi:MAG: type IV secretory system conjugative DNA transfer family protein [Rickettsiales bacterium]